ncbi:MAG: hypothetical protein H7263_04890 [Candidatus Sericytochromatia bacterium]|nr:hypothetical protein [Candidatus Sericytochromatia bacterium]
MDNKEEDKKLLVYLAIGGGIVVMMLMFVLLAYTVYSKRSNTNNQNISNLQNITPIQNTAMPTVIPTPLSTPTTTSTISTINQSSSQASSNLQTKNQLQENMTYALLAIKNRDFTSAEKTLNELSSQNENPELKAQADNLIKNIDKIKSGEFKFTTDIVKTSVEGNESKINVCLLSYFAEHNSLPKFTNVDEFKEELSKTCNIEKDFIDNISNVSVSQTSSNYKVDVNFKSGKSYQYTETGVKPIN